MRSRGIYIVGALLWILVALMIDRLLLANLCLWCANSVTLEVAIKLPGLNLTIPPINIFILLFIPIIVWTVIALPWKEPASKYAWEKALQNWSTPWIWLLIAIALPVVGHFVYSIASEYLPKGISKLAESLALQIKIEIAWPGYKAHTPFDLNASLAAFIGLCIGLHLFFKNGLQNALGNN